MQVCTSNVHINSNNTGIYVYLIVLLYVNGLCQNACSHIYANTIARKHINKHKQTNTYLLHAQNS